jgi:hypothetical protein
MRKNKFKAFVIPLASALLLGFALPFAASSPAFPVRAGDTKDTLSFADENDLIKNAALTIAAVDDKYELRIAFAKAVGTLPSGNVASSFGETLKINGASASQFGDDLRATWGDVGGKYRLLLSLPSSYTGEGALINTDCAFVSNTVSLSRSFALPDGTSLDHDYVLHAYANESVTEVVSEYEVTHPLYVQAISALKAYEKTDEFGQPYSPARHDVFFYAVFSEKICGEATYYVNNPESYMLSSVINLNSPGAEYTLYLSELHSSLRRSGISSSILDHLIINGDSLARWMGKDAAAGSATSQFNIMVHFGMSDLYTMYVYFSDLSPQFTRAYDSVLNDEMTLSFEEGMHFPGQGELRQTQSYQLVSHASNTWRSTSAKSEAVYYDGKQVKEGAVIESALPPSASSVCCDPSYRVEESKKEGDITHYDVYDGEKKVLGFDVHYAVPAPAKKGGCGGSIAGGGIALVLGLLGAAILLGWGKKRRNVL